MSDQPEPRPRPCPLPGFGDKCICILQQSRFRWLTRIAAESSVRGNQDIIPMTCDVLSIFRADTLMRSTTMEKHDKVFIVRITGDRKSVVEGKSVSVRVALGGRRCITKKQL